MFSFGTFYNLLHYAAGGAIHPVDTEKSLFFSDNLAGGETATRPKVYSLVTDFHQMCPQCEQPIFVEKGKVSTCLLCNASQVHDDLNANEKWRNCPNCNIFFRAAPREIVPCPNCRTNQIHPVHHGIVKWERNALNPPVHSDLSHSDTVPESTHNTPKTALKLFLAWWQPYQAGIERFFVTIWPTALFTFTAEERRALRLATRGAYRFRKINDPRLAKWLIHRGGPSAVGGLETIQPEIARHLVKTSESLRLHGIQYIDEQLAECLIQHNGRTLYLDNLHHVDLEVLEILIRHTGRGLSLGGIENLSVQEASVLATYRGRLSLNKLTNPNSEILAALVQHTGKSLSLGSLKTLSRPQAQQLKKYRGDLYLRGIQELPPGIDVEFTDFPQKIVMMQHERRPHRLRNTAQEHAEDFTARIALTVLVAACMVALFALLVASLGKF